MQPNNNLSKRFINYISHVGIILILLVTFPLESCFENYNIAPQKELATKKLERANKNQRNHVFLDDNADSFSEDLYRHNSSNEQETQEVIISPGPVVPVPNSSRIPNYVSSTSTENIPSVENNQEASNLHSNNISEDLIRTTPSFTSTKEQPVSQSGVSFEKENSIRARQETAKQQRESRIIDLERQLEGKVFNTKENDYAVKFYKEKETWSAEVTDTDTRNKFILPAYLSNADIKRLTSISKSGKTTDVLLQVVLSNSSTNTKGYVYIGGSDGGMKRQRSGSKKKEDEEREEEQEESPKKKPAKKSKGKEKEEKGKEKVDNKGGMEVILDESTGEKACGLYKKAEKKYALFKPKKKHGSQNLEVLQAAVKLYKEAAYLGHRQAQERLIALRKDPVEHKAVVNFNKLAMSKYVEAVYKDGSLVYAESKSSSKKKGTSGERYEKKHKKLAFDAFNEKAEQRLKDLAEEAKSNRKIIAHEKLQSMRLSNLIIMDLDLLRVPARIEWGGDYIDPAEANAENIFGPLFDMPSTEEYEHTVLAIDPSSTGGDETAYCVAKRYKDYYFVLQLGGFSGGYELKGRKRKGHSKKVIEKLIKITNQFNVNTIYIENNSDPSLGGHFKRLLREKGLGSIKVIEHSQNRNKRERIVNTLSRLLKEHKIIVGQNALEKDFTSNPQQGGLHYKFFYQLMAIESTSKNTASQPFLGNPVHDDRVDAVALAIEYLQNKRSISTEIEVAISTVEELINERTKATQPNAKKKFAVRDVDKLIQQKYILASLYQELGTAKGRQKAIVLYHEIQEEDLGFKGVRRQELKESNTAREKRQAKELKNKIKQDEIRCKYELAKLYQQLGTPEDQEKAFLLYREIENLDSTHINAKYRLAKFYQTGIQNGELPLIDKDEEQAVRYYREIKKGCIGAQYEWAKLLQNGYQGTQDKVKKI
jgi:TPR repeat protein